MVQLRRVSGRRFEAERLARLGCHQSQSRPVGQSARWAGRDPERTYGGASGSTGARAKLRHPRFRKRGDRREQRNRLFDGGDGPRCAIVHTRWQDRHTYDLKKRFEMSWSLFISHASEDKDVVARPLAEELTSFDLRVWFDEFELKLGDSLLKSIDSGLSRSRYGVVILSHAFFQKHWPQAELAGLVQRELDGDKVILPVWYGVSASDVRKYSPILADKVAANWSRGVKEVAQEIRGVLFGTDITVESQPPLRNTSDLTVDQRRILFSTIVANDGRSDDGLYAAEKLFSDWSEPSAELLYQATETLGVSAIQDPSLWLLNMGSYSVPWLEKLIFHKDKIFALIVLYGFIEYLIWHGDNDKLQRIIIAFQNKGIWGQCLEHFSLAIEEQAKKSKLNAGRFGNKKKLQTWYKELEAIGASLSIDRVT